MEIIKDNTKTLTHKYMVRCKNCRSILLAENGEVEQRVYSEEYGNFYYMHDRIEACPCCHKKDVQVDIIETLTEYV